MKLGFLANGEMLGWDYDKLCAFIRESGYDCVELIDDIIFAPGKTAEDNAKLLAAVEKNGLEISEVLLQHDFVMLDPAARRASIDTVKTNLEKIAALGVKTANLFTGPVPWMPDPVVINRHVSAQQAWQWVFEAFDEIIPVAERFGVTPLGHDPDRCGDSRRLGRSRVLPYHRSRAGRHDFGHHRFAPLGIPCL